MGKFTQGSNADSKRLTRCLVNDQGELYYLVLDMHQSITLVSAPEAYPLGLFLTYYDGSQPHYAHLQAPRLAYAHIHLLKMLRYFKLGEAVRVAIAELYVQKPALHKLEGIGAYVVPKLCG